MPGKFLIDLTDPRFLIDANEDVVRFIRVANPFCHSDVGSVLIDLLHHRHRQLMLRD